MQAISLNGSGLDATMEWSDAAGRVLSESHNGLLGVVCPTTGTYTLAIRDRDYRGGENFRFRINVGAIPIVTAVAPIGLQRGTERTVHVEGVNLATRSVIVRAPADAMPGKKRSGTTRRSTKKSRTPSRLSSTRTRNSSGVDSAFKRMIPL